MDSKTVFKALVVEKTEDRQFVRSIRERTIEELPPGDLLVRAVLWSNLVLGFLLALSGSAEERAQGGVIALATGAGLLILGRNVESFFGKWRFLALFISAGFAGNTLSFLLSPNPSLGSSTAIFGLLAAEAVFVYQNRKFFGSRSRSILINSAIVAAMNLALGLNPGIDNWGHLGGLLGGLLFTFIGGPRWRVEGILPQLEIRDTSTPVRTWFALAAVIVLFGVMAALRILSS